MRNAHYRATWPVVELTAPLTDLIGEATGPLYDMLDAANLAALRPPAWTLTDDHLVASVNVEPVCDLAGDARPDSSRDAYAAELLDRWAA